MKRFFILCAGAVAWFAAGLLPSPTFAQSSQLPDLKGQTLRVATWANGVWHKQASEAFEKATGLQIEWTIGNEPDFMAQLLAAKGTQPPYDIVTLSETYEPQAIQQGLIVKPDYSKIPNAKDIARDLVRNNGYGPAWQYSLFGVAYSPAKFKAAGIPEPKDLSVIADPRLTKHVAMPDVSQINWGGGIIQTVAAYYGHSLSDPAPTLAKISSIKDLIFYTSSNDVDVRYLSGEIWAVLWTDGRVNIMRSKGVDIGFAPMGVRNPKGGVYTYTASPGLVEISNPAKKALAEIYINAMLEKEFQIKYSTGSLYAPANAAALKALQADPKIGRYFTPVSGVFTPDVEAWSKNQAKWVDAWGRAMRR